MALKIEDYALIGDTHTAALVGNNGSIDWLCIPRFDSPACFASLLGEPDNGHWKIAPETEVQAVRRRYRDGTLILETEFETGSGAVAVVDLMPLAPEEDQVDVLRLVCGRRGSVPMRMDFVLRFDYGSIVPWVRRRDDGLIAIGGPDAAHLHAPVNLDNRNFRTTARFEVKEGQTVPFRLAWFPSALPEPKSGDPVRDLEATEAWWREWAGRCAYSGRWREHVLRSLITLKGLTHSETGGIVAAATSSLPEHLGGARNWDYRFCWIRDATFTLYALAISGYTAEARAWREWLLRAVAGKPSQVQIMYGVAGERRLMEYEVPWLAGYEGSGPVRVGNAAYRQRQIDVYGEIIDSFHVDRVHHVDPSDEAWRVEKVLLDELESDWKCKDNGLWEVRGPPRHFTHSKVMAWVAADRAVKAVERYGCEGPVERWRGLRDEIHADVCRKGFNSGRNAFVQYYGSRELDAALLMMPLVGFLPAQDPRIVGTVEAIRRELMHDGLVIRYATHTGIDGLPAGEGAFLACSFWLADTLAMLGRMEEARELFERLLDLQNDVGLLAEEYDPNGRRQLGNFPQAFSHIGLINSAYNLSVRHGPAEERATG